MRGEVRYELGPDWERIGEDHKALEFPILKVDEPALFMDALVPHPSRLAGAGGD